MKRKEKNILPEEEGKEGRKPISAINERRRKSEEEKKKKNILILYILCLLEKKCVKVCTEGCYLYSLTASPVTMPLIFGISTPYPSCCLKAV